MILGVVILVTARLFVPFSVEHPFWMVAFLVLTSVTFALLGFLIGIWADSWEKIQIVPHDGGDAAHLPGRQLLLDLDAAADLAEDHAVQPGGLPGERLPLELLRQSPT